MAEYPVKNEWFPGGTRRSRALLRRAVPIVREAVRGREEPSVTKIAKRSRSPFRVLVGTVISARTKDEVTGEASERLFAAAPDPASLSKLPVPRIEKLIYPAGFYRTKARAIRGLARMLVEEYGGEVPRDLDDLLRLPGVGRKTANLVLTQGFALPGICVDTHVHRVTNRLGAVRTANPTETEYALRRVLPREHWIEINDLLVMYGKAVCAPVSPRCSSCGLAVFCAREGVARSR